MKLNKRSCETRIRLTPCDGDFMRVHLRIGGDNHYFYPSCVMGTQFSSFLTAVYSLYNEGYDEHRLHRRYTWREEDVYKTWEYPWQDGKDSYYKEIPVSWDGEGPYWNIVLSRRSATEEVPPIGVPDPITIKISSTRDKDYQYTIDGRDLCYAIARGYTEALKKYGFHGYLRSTGMQYLGDNFRMDELLFVKAYALDAMDVRELKEAWRRPKGWMRADSSSFEKEMELLLFDM